LRLQKRFETLFAALSDIDPNLKSKIHLVLVGSGPDELAVKSLAKCVSGISVHFVGHQDDVALWFSLADLVVMPSYTEAFGLTAVEAMSCGKPLVASDIEGISEVVQNGISGILVEPKNPSALAVAMTQVLTSQKLAGQLARAAKQRSTQFTVAAMVQGWQNCYDRF
jgi:glycosyltransferase involved in cell wall biosynthesis